MMKWTLLAPGPSLKNLRRDMVDPDSRVVAINSAIVAPVTVDVWCCQDPPENWADLAPGYGGSVVWCKETQVAGWRQLGMKPDPHPADEQAFRAKHSPWPTHVSYTPLTITTALARMVGAGAREITLFGCDMAGTGYFKGEDKKNRAPQVWQERWKAERGILGIAMRQWEEIPGVRFNIVPTPTG